MKAPQATYLGNLRMHRLASGGRVDEAAAAFASLAEPNVFSWNILVTAYAQNGQMREAKASFDSMPGCRNAVSWNSMLCGYVHDGNPRAALELLYRMPKWNALTMTTAIVASASTGDFDAALGFFSGVETRGMVTWNAMLQACAETGRLAEAETLFFQKMPQRDAFSWNAMMQVYAQAGHLQETRLVFNMIPEPNVVAWTALLTAFANHGLIAEAKSTFDGMPERNLVSWNAILSAYAKSGDIDQVRDVLDSMPMHSVTAWNMMLQAQVQEYHSAQDFKQWLQQMPDRNALSWHITVAGLGSAGLLEDAAAVFDDMKAGLKGVVSWNTLLQAYADNGEVQAAEKVLELMPQMDVASWNAMIKCYAHCSQLQSAIWLLHSMPQRDVIAWTAAVTAYAVNGSLQTAIETLHRMPCWDAVAWNVVIDACAQNGRAGEAQQLFEGMKKRDSSGWLSLVVAYAAAGHLVDARVALARMPMHEEMVCNSVLAACVEEQEATGDASAATIAMEIFEKMQQRSSFTWNTMLAVEGPKRKKFYGLMPSWDVVSWNTMLSTLSVDDAKALFDARMPQRDVVSWTALLSVAYATAALTVLEAASTEVRLTGKREAAGAQPGNVQTGEGRETGHEEKEQRRNLELAAAVFERMPCHNVVSWNAMVTGLARNGRVNEARSSFDKMPLRDSSSWNGLLTRYTQNGCLAEARAALQRMPQHNMVSWNAMLTGYVHSGLYHEAMELFRTMDIEGHGWRSQHITLSLLLDAAAGGSFPLALGKSLHDDAKAMRLDTNESVSTSLVNFYAKCGRLNDARHTFDAVPHSNRRNVVTWNTMLSAYARCGGGGAAAASGNLFLDMKLAGGAEPDSITFVALLAAFGHAGYVGEARAAILSMISDFELEPGPEHYACMVDALGRAGELDKAEQVVGAMLLQPDPATLLALLSGCRNHADVDRGGRLCRQLVDGDYGNASPFLLLAAAIQTTF